MPAMFLMLRGPHGEPRWMRFDVQGIEDYRTAIIVREDEAAPEPGTVQAVCFFGRIPEEVEGQGTECFGRFELVS